MNIKASDANYDSFASQAFIFSCTGLKTNLPTSLLNFICWRVGVGKLNHRRLDRNSCSLYLENYILSMKADANRKHTKLDSKAFILFVLLLSYLVNFTACFFVKFKKQFSHTRVVNSKIKEFNCEKARFIAIHTENDADMFILWHCIINARQNF